MLDTEINNTTVDSERLILEAAEAEFLAKGFDGARTTTIAERAGVTHAMLHYYFRTKENLFDKVLEAKSAELRCVFLGFLDNADLPFLQRIELGMRNHFHFLSKNPGLPLFIINELRRENCKVTNHLLLNRDTAGQMVESLQDAIDTAASRGECRPVDAMMLMLDIISLNACPFIGSPMIATIFPVTASDREEFLNKRLEENVQTILNKLKP